MRPDGPLPRSRRIWRMPLSGNDWMPVLGRRSTPSRARMIRSVVEEHHRPDSAEHRHELFVRLERRRRGLRPGRTGRRLGRPRGSVRQRRSSRECAPRPLHARPIADQMRPLRDGSRILDRAGRRRPVVPDARPPLDSSASGQTGRNDAEQPFPAGHAAHRRPHRRRGRDCRRRRLGRCRWTAPRERAGGEWRGRARRRRPAPGRSGRRSVAPAAWPRGLRVRPVLGDGRHDRGPPRRDRHDTIALFSVTHAEQRGARDHANGYRRITGPIGRAIIAEAHDRGRRVDVTYTSFGEAKNDTLFASTADPG